MEERSMGQKEGEGVFGKYILIEAPNFNNAKSDAAAMSSYLRLGAVKDLSIAASSGAPKASGEDLAALVTSFIDDNRVREGCPAYLSPGERQAETALLHTKGGWRDHSDGNRVTTTRGDKVEIIKGNYRMLVLGRQDDQAGWDVSGGHIGESSITFGGSSKIEWVQNYAGTWRVTEETIKGDVYTMYMGDVKDEYWGNFKTSSTGSEAPTLEKPNPVVMDKTWALSIASYTGSAALPVPTISDETWAAAITSTTNADAVTDTTTVTGAITSTTTVGGAITDTTTAGAMTSTTVAGVITDTTTAAAVNSITTASLVSDLTIGNMQDIIIGSEMEVIVGNSSQITVGAEESLTVGATLELMIGLAIELTLAGRIELNLGPVLDLSPAKVSLDDLKTEINLARTQMSSSHNILTVLKKVMAAQIQLG
jgi:hypothetical protein